MLIKKAIGQKPLAVSNIFLTIAFCLLPLASFAQCAMCRASLESEGNKTRVEAVNDGIILLMAVPYIIVGLIGFAIYKMYFKKNRETKS
jgi:heme/copper-type cytochrome/quinol oxidase subunit 2